MARLVIDMPSELRVRSDSTDSNPHSRPNGSLAGESLPPDVRQFLSWFACWSPLSR